MLLKKIEEIYNNLILMITSFDPRIFAVTALISIIVSAISTFFSNLSLAESAANYAYFSLLLLVILEAIMIVYAKLSHYVNSNSDGFAKGSFIDALGFITSSKYFIILYTTVAIVLPWITNNGYLFFVDYTWGPNVSWLDWSQPFAPIFNILIMLGYILGNSLVQKLFVSSVVAFVLFAGFRLGGASIAIMALFNPFVYDRLAYGQFNIVLGYAFLILIMAKFSNDYNSGNFKMTSQKALLYASLYGLSIISSPHYIFITGLLIAGLFLFIYSWPRNGLVTILYFIIPTILINSIWLFNNIFGRGDVINFVNSSISNLDFELFQTIGNGFFARLINNIQLMGFWGSATGRYLDISSRALYFWPFIFISIGVGYGLLKIYRENKGVFKFLLYLSIITLILAQATSILLLKTFLYELPFYSGLREPQKWIALLVVIYLFTLNTFIKNERKYYANYLMPIASILWVPYILFGLWGQVKSISYPQYWSTINSELVNNRCFKEYDSNGKILILPWHMYMSYNWTQKVSANPAANFFDCENILVGSNMELGGVYDNSGSALGNQVSEWVSTKGASSIPVEVSAIILFKEVDWQTYNYISTTTFKKISETNNYILYKKI